MSNYGRYNLVTRFKCSKCGNQLQLSYEKESSAKGNKYEQDGITGGDKVENNIWIEPCEQCVDYPMSQLSTLREILKDIR